MMSEKTKLLRIFLFCFCIQVSSLWAEELCDVISGSALVAQDGENSFLGKVASPYSSDSIFNEYGVYGSEYSGRSIWNRYSSFGNEYNIYSPHNAYTTTPPMIIKKGRVIGYLSANKSVKPSISPNLLKVLCEKEF